MKTLYLFIFFLGFSAAGFSQCTGNTDGNGLKQGTWKCYYDKNHKHLKSLRNYRDDMMEGEQKYYNKKGKLTSIRYLYNEILCKVIMVKKDGSEKTVVDLKCKQ